MASTPSFDPNELSSPQPTNGSRATPRARRLSIAPLSSAMRRARRSRSYGDRGDRLRHVSRRSRGQRARRRGRLRRAAGQRRPRELRRTDADRSAHQIGQHGLCPGGRAGRQGHARPLHEPLRLRLQATARLPGRRDVGQRRVPARAPDQAGQPVRRRRPHGHRPGQAAGDAAADGAGRRRGGKSRRADASRI